MPDWPAIHEELRGNKHVTLQLLWQEYKQANPEGYSYTRFCELYRVLSASESGIANGTGSAVDFI
jgi:transposase